VRSCQKLPLCLTEPVPDSSKVDPLLAKTTSDGGSASGVTYLRGIPCCETAVEREELDYVRETTLQTPRSVKKEGEEVLQMPEQRFSPAACDEDHGEAGCRPAAHGGPWWGRSPPAAHGRPHAEAGGCLKEAVTPSWSRLLAGPADLWRDRSPCWSRFAGRAFDRMGDPHWSSLLLKDCTPWEGPTLEQLMKNCSP